MRKTKVLARQDPVITDMTSLLVLNIGSNDADFPYSYTFFRAQDLNFADPSKASKIPLLSSSWFWSTESLRSQLLMLIFSSVPGPSLLLQEMALR